MNLTLRSFSQDVNLANPEEVRYFLILEGAAGKVIRLPVQKETTEALIKALYSKDSNVEAAGVDEEVAERGSGDGVNNPVGGESSDEEGIDAWGGNYESQEADQGDAPQTPLFEVAGDPPKEESGAPDSVDGIPGI